MAVNTQRFLRCSFLLMQRISRRYKIKPPVVFKDEIIHPALSVSANLDTSSSSKER